MRWCILSIFVWIFVGCDVPSAAIEEHPTLVIATDQLSKEDSTFFHDFGKQHGLTIDIIEISTDSLIGLYKDDPYGLGIDIVFSHQLYNMRRIRNTKMLEPIKTAEFPEDAVMAETREFIKIGIDPFVCVSKTNVRINVYDDLNEYPFFSNLNHKSKTQFFSPYEERLHRSKTFERMEKMHNSLVPMRQNYADSAKTILTTYSSYKLKNVEDTIWNDFTDVQFPNSSTSGIFHDALTAGVIRQSSNYIYATKMLHWLVEAKMNRRFVALRGYEPLRSTGQYRRFATSPEILMQYHTMIERMLKELP